MARIRIAMQGWGWVANRSGDSQGGVTVTILNRDETNATIYSARVGGTTSSGTAVTDADGYIPGYLDEDEYILQVPGESDLYVQRPLAPPSAGSWTRRPASPRPTLRRSMPRSTPSKTSAAGLCNSAAVTTSSTPVSPGPLGCRSSWPVSGTAGPATSTAPALDARAARPRSSPAPGPGRPRPIGSTWSPGTLSCPAGRQPASAWKSRAPLICACRTSGSRTRRCRGRSSRNAGTPAPRA